MLSANENVWDSALSSDCLQCVLDSVSSVYLVKFIDLYFNTTLLENLLCFVAEATPRLAVH